MPRRDDARTYSWNSERLRLANSRAVFSNSDGKTVKKMVACFPSSDSSTLVTVMREEPLFSSWRKRAPRSCNTSFIRSWRTVILLGDNSKAFNAIARSDFYFCFDERAEFFSFSYFVGAIFLFLEFAHFALADFGFAADDFHLAAESD